LETKNKSQVLVCSPTHFSLPADGVIVVGISYFPFSLFLPMLETSDLKTERPEALQVLAIPLSKVRGYEKGIKGNVWLGIDFAISFACNFDAI